MTLTNGLVVMTPTSIAHSGTSASINADGSVEFSAMTNLELRGVFTGDYDNYMVSIRWSASAQTTVRNRFMSGTTPANGANYTTQKITADGTSVTAGRFGSETYGAIGRGNSAQINGVSVIIYGPYLAQPTVQRTVSSDSTSNAQIVDDAVTHSLPNSYDGLNIFLLSDNMSGSITVFGFNQ
jgi:hypothetical protein